MYEHAVVEDLLCIAVLQAQHSLAQSPPTKPQSTYVPVSENGSKQTERAYVRYCSTASTKAQHSTAQSARTSRKESTCQSECDNASQQTKVGENDVRRISH